jgi:hypothetical protein
MTEDPNGRPIFPRRSGSDLRNEEMVGDIISALADLEIKTRPDGEDKTAKQKDFIAIEALRLAGGLVDILAGWAIDHQVGMAMKGLQFVPHHPENYVGHGDFVAAVELVDSHEHERDGAWARREGKMTPEISRLALVNLLRGNPGAFPEDLQRAARNGFEALNYSEVLPLMAPTESDRKVKLSELLLQLEAVALVEYRVARNEKKIEALKEVSAAFGVSLYTLRTWDSRIRIELGQYKVSRELGYARDTAKRDMEEGYRLGHAQVGTRDILSGRGYGPEMLRRAARRYKEFKGFNVPDE